MPGNTTFPSRTSLLPGLRRERVNPVYHHRIAAPVAVHEHLAFLRHLHVKDPALMGAAVTVRKGSNQEDASLSVDFYFAVTELGNGHGDRPTTGTFHDLVHEFLWEGIEHDGSRPLAVLALPRRCVLARNRM